MPNDSRWIVRTTRANGTVFTAFGDGSSDQLILLAVYVGDLLTYAGHNEVPQPRERKRSALRSTFFYAKRNPIRKASSF